MTRNEQLMAFYLEIQGLEQRLSLYSKTEPSRELALSITKLQEARLWISEKLSNSGAI